MPALQSDCLIPSDLEFKIKINQPWLLFPVWMTTFSCLKLFLPSFGYKQGNLHPVLHRKQFATASIFAISDAAALIYAIC